MTPNVKAVQKTLFYIYSKKGPFAFEAKEWVKNADCTRSLLFKFELVYVFQSWCFFITSLYKPGQANSNENQLLLLLFSFTEQYGTWKHPSKLMQSLFLAPEKTHGEIIAPYIQLQSWN